MEERTVTLTELLDAREERAARQKALLEKYGGVLVSVTLNIPGPVKDRPGCREAMEKAMEELDEKLAQAGICGQPVHREIRHLATGSEGYAVLDGGTAPEQVKGLTMEIEEASELGRLFDMDVLFLRERKLCGVSRKELGGGMRKCLICGGDAKVCARSQRHEMRQLLAETDRILAAVKPRSDKIYEA